jgi:hypothetical protein
MVTSNSSVCANSSWDGKITHNIRLRGGGGLRDSHGTHKGIRMIPHERNLSLEFLRTLTTQREGVS